MMNRFRSALLVSVLVMAFVVPALAPTARAALSVPVWRPGDYWVYEMTGDASPTPDTTGTVRYEIVGTEPITVGSTSYTAYHAELTFNVSYMGYPMEMPGDEWFRTSDLSPVKFSFSFTIMTVTFSMNATYDPPIEYRWPLTPGATWTASSTVTTTIEMTGSLPQTDVGTISETLRVDPEESRTVPAGTFTTLPLVETQAGGGDYRTGYWSGVAGNVAEQTSYASNGTEMGGMELVSYHYSGPGGDGNILGLPAIAWVLILVPVLFIVIAAVLLLRRRRHEVPPAMPHAQPPLVPPTQPGGPNPPSP